MGRIQEPGSGYSCSRSPLRQSLTMADVALSNLSASNIFDLRGVIAVVTGGGTVRGICTDINPKLIIPHRVSAL